MGKKKNKKDFENRYFGRRQFLIGAGSMLFLPPLTSLMPNFAFAEAVGRTKRVILCPTLFGINPGNFFPVTPPLAMQTMFNSPDAPVYTTPLSAFAAGGFSSALGTAFDNPVLRAKMNLYEGLDVTNSSEIVSHTRSSLGGRADYPEPQNGTSIDNLIAKKMSNRIPVLRMSTSNKASIGWSFETAPGVATKKHSFYMGDKDIFNFAFGSVPAGGTTTPGLPQADIDKLSIADKVLADYNSLKQNRRISTSDKQLLESYVASINDLQKKVNSNNAPLTCTRPTLPIQVTKTGQYYAFPGDYDGLSWGITSTLTMMRNYNEIIRSAFICDLTRVVVLANDMFTDAPMSTYNAEALFHSHDNGTGGPLTTAQKHGWFLNRLAELALLLDSTPDPLSASGSLLDNTVIMFTNEHGNVVSHSSFSIPTLTIGSAGGALKTGYYIDTRQRPYTKTNYHDSRGRPAKQLLISIMEAFGLTSTDYLDTSGNFGQFGVNAGANFPGAYSKFTATHNTALPFIKA